MAGDGTAKEARRPNILWLLTDHHVYAHHRELAGGYPRMPAYERLAREGVHFERAYSVCPLCTPARASMLTGVYPHRHGMVMNNGDCGSRLDFEPEQKLFSHYLREAGYRAGYFGKWHCGDVRTALDYEFEGWTVPGYGCPYVTDEYAEYCRELGIEEAMLDIEWHWTKPELTGPGVSLREPPHPWARMGSSGVLTTPVESHEAYFVTHLACKWLDEVARSGESFCLRVDVWGPHFPYWVGGEFANTVDPASLPEYPSFRHTLADRPRAHRAYSERSHERCTVSTWEEWRPVLARCYEQAHLVDSCMGRMLDKLDELGLADDTLVIYTADHGDMIGAHGGLFDKGYMMVEETERVPLAVRWPGQVPAGVVSDAFVTNMDPVPTVLEAAGAEIPAPMDARSLLGLASDPDDANWPDDVMCTSHGHGVRCFQRLLRWGDYKYVAHLGDLDELYDLGDDPYEMTNRVDDPAMKEVLAEGRERLVRRMDEYEDDEPDSRRLLDEMTGTAPKTEGREWRREER